MQRATKKTVGDIWKGNDDLQVYKKKSIWIEGGKQIYGTHYTIAGLVSSMCGVPLYARTLFVRRSKGKMGKIFMPNVICIRDILKKAGYTNVFYSGGYASFQQAEDFMITHNFDKVYSAETMESRHSHEELSGSKEIFGYNDDILFSDLKNDIQNIFSKSPVFLAILTISAHTPGLATRHCLNMLKGYSKSIFRKSIKCQSIYIKDFINFLERRGYLENSLVFVMSDHLSMQNDITGILDNHQRENTFFIYSNNIPKSKIIRPYSSLDRASTILDAAGYKLNRGKFNLGYSVFAKYPNLTEKYGVDKLNTLIQYNGNLKRKLWEIKK